MARDNQTLGKLPPRRASRRRRAACRRSRSPSTSTPTASSTSPPRTRRTDKEQTITHHASSGLSEADIQKMVKDAEAARGRGQAAQGGDRGAQPARLAGLPDGEDARPRTATRSTRRRAPRSSAASRTPRRCSRRTRTRQGRGAVQDRVRELQKALVQDGRADVQDGGSVGRVGGGGAGGGGARRRPSRRPRSRRTSSTPSSKSSPSSKQAASAISCQLRKKPERPGAIPAVFFDDVKRGVVNRRLTISR